MTQHESILLKWHSMPRFCPTRRHRAQAKLPGRKKTHTENLCYSNHTQEHRIQFKLTTCWSLPSTLSPTQKGVPLPYPSPLFHRCPLQLCWQRRDHFFIEWWSLPSNPPSHSAIWVPSPPLRMEEPLPNRVVEPLLPPILPTGCLLPSVVQRVEEGPSPALEWKVPRKGVRGPFVSCSLHANPDSGGSYKFLSMEEHLLSSFSHC